MPTLQVLEREPDKRSEMLLQIGQNVSQNILAAKQADAYLYQVKLQAKNAANDYEKQQLERKHNAIKDLIELKKLGIGEEGAKAYLKVYGADGFDAMNGLGEAIANAKSPTDELKSAQADVLRQLAPARESVMNAQAAAAPVNAQSGAMNAQANLQNSLANMERVQNQIRQLDIMERSAQTDQDRLMIQQERVQAQNYLDATRAGLLKSVQGQLVDGTIGQAMTGDTEGDLPDVNPRSLITGGTVGGINFAMPEAQGRLEAEKTSARNKANQETRQLTDVETTREAVAGTLEDTLKNIIEKVKTRRLNLLQKAGVDTRNAAFAGQDIEDLQSDINQVKLRMSQLSGLGANYTDKEMQLVDVLLNMTGKADKNIEKDVQSILDTLVYGRVLRKKGVSGMKEIDAQRGKSISGNGTAQVGRFTVEEVK